MISLNLYKQILNVENSLFQKCVNVTSWELGEDICGEAICIGSLKNNWQFVRPE